jgi:PIN domain nuclease of toxin-antitoxin system
MKYLLDTHTLIWLITKKEKLSAKVAKIIENPENEIAVSAISFWEISLKYSLGKLQLEGGTPENIYESVEILAFDMIPLSPKICNTFHHLTGNYHRDPFDKMLIWLAISDNYTLLSCDPAIQLYQSEGLKILW